MNVKHSLFMGASLVCLWPGGAWAAVSPTNWDLMVVDRLLTSAAPGQAVVAVGDMWVPAPYLRAWRDRLAGGPQPNSAFGGGFTAWPGGNVYYVFSNNVSAVQERACEDCMNEWAMFANLHFLTRTTQTNYVLISVGAGLEGGESAVGMIGGVQPLQVGPAAWNHGTLCHELGHTLGLVHEHQRSDRDGYVAILTNNLEPGAEGNFVLLTDSQNRTAYDFLSVMHYSRTNSSIDALHDSIEPLPPYMKYLNIMGQSDPVLSAGDRAGMAAMYGAGPAITNVVTNTQDSGPGSLRAALYYAFDHPGTTITFDIPTTDPGYSNNVFNILPSGALPGVWNNTVVDGGTEPVESNPDGPAVLLNGALTWALDTFPSGLQFRGTNSAARSFVINSFPESGVLFDGSNCVGNAVGGCYLGIDPSGTLPVSNGICPVQISGGARFNVVGGLTPAARNVIGGGTFQGIAVRDPGTCFNVVEGNYIGLNAAGIGPLSNRWAGIQIFGGAQSNLIGGYTAWARNIISGNGLQGVAISDMSTMGNVVAGNYIGLNPAGTAAIGNGGAGLDIFSGATANVVGGDLPGARNVISGNGLQGVLIQYPGTAGNSVQGNLVGLNAEGNAAISNTWSGVEINNGASANVVGGYGGARNFISGNGNYGVYIDFANGNAVEGNTIGLDVSGVAVIPNGYAAGFAEVGLYEASSNSVGGVFPGAANIIAGSPYVGVQVAWSATNNPIRGNSIFGNGGAINIYSGGNDELDAPSLNSAVVGTNTTVSGSYAGTVGQIYQIDFYSDAPPADSAECQTYLGSISVVGGGSAVTFDVSLGVHLPAGRAVTATATDMEGNTSQTSAGVAVTMTSSVNDGIPDAWRKLYFGGSGMTTNSQSAAEGDADHTGLNNYSKFLAGLDPTNPASRFELTALAPGTSTNAVSLRSSAGTVYRILTSDDLADGPWVILTDQILGTGTNMLFADPAAIGEPVRFYRAEVLW